MSTQLTRIVSPSVALAIAAALALAACNRDQAPPAGAGAAAAATPAPASSTEIAWARAAIERNPDLEVVAVDPQSGVITVKSRSSGEVEAIKASELAAVTPSQLKPMEMQAAPPPEPEPGPTQQDRATAGQQQATASETDRSEGSPPQSGLPSGYTIERADGKIRVSGPGVSIESSGTSASARSQASGGRRAVDPFICEGRRTLQLDNREIYVDGDAITVRGGCEVFITNSNIVATGTGIVVQDATVHISNSHIEGASASFQADDRSKMYVRGSTFQGVPRRTELAVVQDQGGNRWR